MGGCGGANAADNCTWSNVVNDWNADFYYECPDNKVFTGMSSEPMNSNNNNNNQQWRQQDRRFKVACCAIHNKQARNCRLQEKYANNWGDFMTWWVPERHIITGVYSEYNSAISDRRWRFIVCEI